MSDEPQTIREMAEADAEQTEATELFRMGTLDGDGITLADLIKPGEPVRYTVSMNGTSEIEAPKGGMLDMRKEHLLLVTCEVAHPTPVPQRTGDRATGKTIESWKVRQKLTPVYVERVQGEEGAILAGFIDLLHGDAHRAAALFDQMKDRLQTALSATT